MHLPRRIVSLLHVAVFLAFSAGWVVAMSLLAAIALVAAGVPSLQAASDPDVLVETLGGAGLGVLTMVQIGVLAGAAWLAAGALPPTDAPTAVRRARAFPVGRPSAWMLGAALVGGLTLWTLPSWIAERLVERVDAPSTPELLLELLQSGSLGGRLVVAIAIGISAPLCEEIVFRGYLWRAIELGWGRIAAWLGTTLLFAAYHLDPVQSVSLLPVALFIGWLRLRSGSIVPAVLAHFVNNALGLSLALTAGDEEGSVGLPLAMAGACAALTAAAVASRYAPGRSNSST
jgi:uncharacterized protein